jgi:hypothetical protein
MQTGHTEGLMYHLNPPCLDSDSLTPARQEDSYHEAQPSCPTLAATAPTSIAQTTRNPQPQDTHQSAVSRAAIVAKHHPFILPRDPPESSLMLPQFPVTDQCPGLKPAKKSLAGHRLHC